jgi:hypothetical protein
MTSTPRLSLHRPLALLALVVATSSACSERPAPAAKPQRPNTSIGREDRLAAQLVDELFQVAPGEQVVLRGGPAYLPIMQAIAIRVLGAGGKVHLLTTTDRERRYRAQEMPLEYLGPPPSSIDSALILQSDLEINLPYDSDFRSIWPDVTSERFRRHQRSNPILSRLNEQSARRYFYLAMPTQPDVVAAVRQAGVLYRGVAPLGSAVLRTPLPRSLVVS